MGAALVKIVTGSIIQHNFYLPSGVLIVERCQEDPKSESEIDSPN